MSRNEETLPSDLSRPAYTAQEAVQWVYMAYLAAVKEQDGAAMSLGNVSSFLDIYMEYELSKGTITEFFESFRQFRAPQYSQVRFR